jgi:Rieske Fe-S protein
MQIIDNRIFLSKVEQDKRLSICNDCEYKGEYLDVMVCTNCGCPLKVKSKIQGFHCPIKKW